MSQQANITFEVTNWDEKPTVEWGEKSKITRATVTETLAGDLAGESTIEYTMAYRDDQTSDISYIQRISGTLAGKTGTFVLQGDATFNGAVVEGCFRVLEGFGTGDLAALTGTGTFHAKKEPRGTMTLDYTLP